MKGKFLLLLLGFLIIFVSGCFPYYTYEPALICTADGEVCEVVSKPVLNYPATTINLGYGYNWNYPYHYRGYHHGPYRPYYSPPRRSHWPPRHYNMGVAPAGGVGVRPR